MIQLRLLGEIQLKASDGSDLNTLLRMPKRLALLAYLAMPVPGTWHRRDALLALFWPELDTSRARTALRNALYVLRQELGDQVVRARGDEEVSVDAALLQTDIGELWQALQDDRVDDVLAAYQGELLAGLYSPESDGFMRWLDLERARLRNAVTKAAGARASALERSEEFPRALEIERRLLEIQPDDETCVRRVMALHERLGDRVGALAVFEAFRARLAAEFEAEPSAETLELVQRLRAPASPTVASAKQPAQRWRVASASPPASGEAANAPPSTTRRHATSRFIVAGGVLIILAALTSVFVVLKRRDAHADSPRSILIMPMENATGDSTLDYLATGIAENLGERMRLSRVGEVHAPARAQWAGAMRRDVLTVGRKFGASLILRTRLTQANDSLSVSGDVIDAATGRTRSFSALRFTPTTVQDLESQLFASAFGTAFRAPIPQDPRPSAWDLDPESYRLTLQGWQELLANANRPAANKYFAEATRRDPRNARAWAGLSSVRAGDAVTWGMPFDEGASATEAAAEHALTLDSLQGSALANLAIIRGLRDRNLAAAESLFARARAAEPSNPEIFLVESALLRHGWQWAKARDAIRIAQRLDPLSPMYPDREGLMCMCADSAVAAIAFYQAAMRLDPNYKPARDGMARALARLGRWDDALEFLDAKGLKGEEGYWKYRTDNARLRLNALIKASRMRWVSKARLGVHYIGAGEVDRGLTLLEEAAHEGDVGIYRLPCQPDVDRVRDLPRFKRLLEYASRTIPR